MTSSPLVSSTQPSAPDDDLAATEEVAGLDRALALADEWDDLLASDVGRLEGPDLTGSSAWALALWRVHLEKARVSVLTARHGGALDGLISIARRRERVARIPLTLAHPVTEIYSGRSGVVTGGRTHGDTARGLLEAMLELDWDVLRITLTDGGATAQSLAEICRRKGLRMRAEVQHRTPYIVLEGDWDRFFAGLAKKFRYHLRNSRKKLEARGTVTYRQFRGPHEVEEFLDHVWRIERQSWKENAGTSITANPYQQKLYTLIVPGLARRDWFSGHVLFLDGQPVAHVLGGELGGVFHDFKESYDDRHRDASPSQVLKLHLLPYLFEAGFHLYDFRGTCEDYKLRWTDRTYSRTTHVVYKQSWRGRLAALLHRVRDVGSGEAAERAAQTQ